MDDMYELMAIYQSISAVGVLVSFAISVFTIVTMWFVYSKAGEGGWKILIPIYGEYIRYKIAGCAKRFWIQFVLGLLSIVFMAVFAFAVIQDNPELAAISVIAAGVFSLAAAIIGITVNFKMATAFGLSGAFGLGLWLLPVIFYAIIAFSSSIRYALNRNSMMY